ncbi:MAG: hypothetical protein AMJ46_00360 [Latescibacteria bacterium DG_63]|nr:MAG: hypothetical protein AMJ46_00360 [Latescibacteria bacterium DG_63]
MILALLGLALFPILTYRWSKRRYPNHIGLATGAATGLVVSPFSLGLYATYFIPLIGFVPGMIGLLLTFFHEPPGLRVATFLGLRDSKAVGGGLEHVQIQIINGIIWGVVYGLIGQGIDTYRSFKRRRASRLEFSSRTRP